MRGLLRRIHPELRPLVAVTAVGAALVAVAYWTVFETGSCDGRGDVACMFNQNQGIFAFLAIVVAMGGLWVDRLGKLRIQRAKRRDEIIRTQGFIGDAVEELVHNLQHVRLGYESDPPEVEELGLEFGATFRLLQDSSARPGVPAALLSSVETLIRNVSDLQACYGWDAQDPAEKQEAVQGAVESIVNNTMRFLVTAGMRREFAHAIHGEGFDFLVETAQLLGSAGFMIVQFRASDAKQADLAHARKAGAPLMCWAADAEVRGVEIREFSTWIGDLGHLPHSRTDPYLSS